MWIYGENDRTNRYTAPKKKRKKKENKMHGYEINESV